MAGQLIVLEGIDGAGKSTQFGMLCQRLEGMGSKVQRLAFPQYDSPSSALIRMYLRGDFGRRPEDVNPYAASSFYAVDRYASFQQVWGEAYRRGELVLADRYTTSNGVHQAVKCPEQERESFWRWLEEYEYDKLGLPRPDLVIFLDMPISCAIGLLRQRERESQSQGDIHEVNVHYLTQCYESARQAAQALGWNRISCVNQEGVLRSIQEIHQDVWAFVEPVVFGMTT